MRFVHFIVTFFTLLLFSLAAAGLYAVHYVNQDGPLLEDSLVDVEKGWGLNRLSAHLEAQNIIENAAVFKAAGYLHGKSMELRSGEYHVEAGSSILDLLNLFTEGQAFQRGFTVPEGATSYEIIQSLNQNDELRGEAILQIPEEGSLLPETYHFTKGDSRQDIIARMQADLNAVLDSAWASRQANLPLKSRQEALTLASIIEKETGVKGERRRVAGVFINRLRIGMALQTDPTVIYAITKGKHQNNGRGPLGRRLLRKDLKIDSPYNTYRYPGLPPGPIANAGKAAIEAALNPEDHDYLYFVADGTGGHVFSKTLAEHNANAAKWRIIRKQQND
tara:strand:- start:713634 stop:714635 length:1002 start_codon:yes stop_codon:yes gene_type:complete